jgi:hypothetical protein
MSEKLNEPKWKNDLVKAIWAYARSNGLTVQDGNHDNLPKGLGDLVVDIRSRCDCCGRPRILKSVMSPVSFSDIDPYQCCWVHSETEDYCPHYCVECHWELQKQRPHDIISV